MIWMVALATFLTSALSSVFGMLGGLLLMAILVEWFSVPQAFVLHGLFQLTANGYRAWLNRADILWRPVRFFLVGVGALLLVLGFLTFSPDRAWVLIALGLVPFAASAIPDGWRLKISTPSHAGLAGVVVGGVNVVAGVAGPLLDVFFQQAELNRKQVVATKAVLQSFGHVAKVGYFLWLAGFVAVAEVPTMGLLVAGMVASVFGTTVGKQVLDRLTDDFFFRWTQRILWGIGAFLLARGLMTLIGPGA